MSQGVLGSIDWAGVIREAASSPLGIVALVVIAVSILAYALIRDPKTTHHYRFAALVLVLLGAGLLTYSALRAWESNLIPAAEAVDTTAPVEEPSSPERVERVREQSFYDRNPHCAAPREVNWNVGAAEAWRIDIESVDVQINVRSSQSNFIGVVNLTERGFQLNGRIVNNGDCGPFWKDGRGALGVVVRYTEYRYD